MAAAFRRAFLAKMGLPRWNRSAIARPIVSSGSAGSGEPMGRRKGFPRLAKSVTPYGADHPVAGMIGRGSHWFDAWVAQLGTPYPKVARLSGIAVARLFGLSHGAVPTDAEIDALAPAWYVTPEDLWASIAQSMRAGSRAGEGLPAA
jgi:hypothetical protein